MITLESDRLIFRFPEVHEDARCSLGFRRTLRIPDDGKDYPLPPGLGNFPLRHLDDYARRLPESWLRRGGAIFPMRQAEAMWIGFGFGFGYGNYPCAVKVAAGKICAVTGDPWADRLNTDPQDYLALPDQPWLDGYCVEKGVIRQFVAMPLGEGHTAEEQLTGAAQHGGLQFFVCPMKRERYEALAARRDGALHDADIPGTPDFLCRRPMGLAPGGRMKQEIYDDPHGLDAWDQRHARRCFVTIVNSAQWLDIAGERPPTEPLGAKDYTEAGLPWFDYYDGDRKARSGAPKLAGLTSVVAAKRRDGAGVIENESVDVSRIVRLRAADANRVREYRVDGRAHGART